MITPLPSPIKPDRRLIGFWRSCNNVETSPDTTHGRTEVAGWQTSSISWSCANMTPPPSPAWPDLADDRSEGSQTLTRDLGKSLRPPSRNVNRQNHPGNPIAQCTNHASFTPLQNVRKPEVPSKVIHDEENESPISNCFSSYDGQNSPRQSSSNLQRPPIQLDPSNYGATLPVLQSIELGAGVGVLVACPSPRRSDRRSAPRARTGKRWTWDDADTTLAELDNHLLGSATNQTLLTRCSSRHHVQLANQHSTPPRKKSHNGTQSLDRFLPHRAKGEAAVNDMLRMDVSKLPGSSLEKIMNDPFGVAETRRDGIQRRPAESAPQRSTRNTSFHAEGGPRSRQPSSLHTGQQTSGTTV